MKKESVVFKIRVHRIEGKQDTLGYLLGNLDVVRHVDTSWTDKPVKVNGPTMVTISILCVPKD